MASVWAAQVVKIVGGKAGGKGNTSTGSGTDTSKVAEGLDAARIYLQKVKES